jgi:hypothetical protein
MITEPSLARHGVLPPDGQRFANLLLHLLAGMLLLPLILIASFVIFFAYWNFMPAYSASTIVPDLQARVSLRFYYTSGQESGRSVIIETPRGSTTIEMCGFDWAHWGRTSVYRTSDRGLAIVGLHDCDYLVSHDLTVIPRPAPASSADWDYVGAFDLVFISQGRADAREMRFIPAEEQAECIIMGGSDFVHSWMTRKEARHPDCPWPRVEYSKR